MGKFGAAVGSGAAKLGKKAAQSEAGRSAGRAAISGAADGVKDDLTNRYLGEGGSRESSPVAAPPPQPKHSAKPSSSSTSSSSSSSSSQPHHQATAAAPSSFHSDHRPPKPSLLNQFRPHINKTSSKPARRPVRQSSRKERVYKYNLSKEANWEEKLKVQTLYNFKSGQRSDLEFRKGQIIEVLTRTDNQFDWWEGKLEDRVGIFPANYVKIMRD